MAEDKYDENFRNRMKEVFELLEKFLGKFPESLRKKVEIEISKIQELIMDTREPRLAIVGRRGSGKSSLINAIFSEKVAEVGAVHGQTGKGIWYPYEDKNKKGKLSILDTRGLGEGGKPIEGSTEATAEKEIMSSIAEKCPDTLLFLCKAKEVDARIDEDLSSLKKIKTDVQKAHDFNPPIIGIVTQVDELDPISVKDPPFNNPTKQDNIATATRLLSNKISSQFNDVIECIPISAYAEFDDKKKITYDKRWNIDKLVFYLIDQLPLSAQLELAKITGIKTVQRKIARYVVGSAAAIAGLVGAEPIPLADLPVITGIQVGMIIAIGYISGREMNKKSAVEFMTAMGLNVGAAFVLREIARALVKLIPVAGDAVAGAVAAAATWGIGEAAIAYFIDEKKQEEAIKIYEEETKKRK